MGEVPSPAQLAATRAAAKQAEADAAVGRECVKRVRQRERLLKGSRLTSHISDETALTLAKISHPTTNENRRTHGSLHSHSSAGSCWCS